MRSEADGEENKNKGRSYTKIKTRVVFCLLDKFGGNGGRVLVNQESTLD